jgi:hypothetical protein
MADVGQVFATGGTALVSAAAGAGLTYWFGALNRRHQEAREDRTRWYEARFKAYAEFSRAVTSKVLFPASASAAKEERDNVREELASLLSDIRLVCSENVVGEAEQVFGVATKELRKSSLGTDTGELLDTLYDFEVEARRDLGYKTKPQSQAERQPPSDSGEEDAG